MIESVKNLPYGGIDLAETARKCGGRIERCTVCGQESYRSDNQPSPPCFRCDLNLPPQILPEYDGLDRQAWRDLLREEREAYNRGEGLDPSHWHFSLTDHLTEVILAKLNRERKP